MVPLEDDLDVVTEFLLVPYAGACIHVPPPPPNQIVYVKMDKNTQGAGDFYRSDSGDRHPEHFDRSKALMGMSPTIFQERASFPTNSNERTHDWSLYWNR